MLHVTPLNILGVTLGVTLKIFENKGFAVYVTPVTPNIYIYFT